METENKWHCTSLKYLFIPRSSTDVVGTAGLNSISLKVDRLRLWPPFSSIFFLFDLFFDRGFPSVTLLFAPDLCLSSFLLPLVSFFFHFRSFCPLPPFCSIWVIYIYPLSSIFSSSLLFSRFLLPLIIPYCFSFHSYFLVACITANWD